jgi:uncharacterized protein YijF (DUF1287 family)
VDKKLAFAIFALWVASPQGFARAEGAPSFGMRLATAALERTQHRETYDPAYVRIPYPLGDVAADRGVCADVVIRSFRVLGIDLQVLVHEDMRQAFGAYPHLWGLREPDSNIDHRRVPNLETFFRRHGHALPISRNASAYQPGDIVSWRLDNRLPHIGIVSAERTADGKRPLIVHNVGAGPKLEDVLFAYPLAGHFRYEQRT